MTPANVSLSAGQTQQFTAAISGSANTAVTWSVSASGLDLRDRALHGSGEHCYPAERYGHGDKSGRRRQVGQRHYYAYATGVNGFVSPGCLMVVRQCEHSGTLVSCLGERFERNLVGHDLNRGKVNQALSFNGVDSVVTVPDSPKLQFLNSMTISVWIRTVNNSRREAFIGKYDATGAESGYILQTLPSGGIQLRVGGINVLGTREVADATPVNNGQWRHVAVVIYLGQNVQFTSTVYCAQLSRYSPSRRQTPLRCGSARFRSILTSTSDCHSRAAWTASRSSIRPSAELR